MTLLYYVFGVSSGLLIVFVIAELGARWWLKWRGKYFVWPPGMRLRLHIDQNKFPYFEPIVRWEINRDGERGNTPPGNRKRAYRILAAGGSPTEAYPLDQPSTWPGKLEQLLQRPENMHALGVSQVHVGNVGKSLVGSCELEVIFEKILPRYAHLDVVVIMVGGTDIIKWLKDGAPVNWDTSPPAVSEIFSCHPEGPYSWVIRGLAMTEILRRWRSRWLRPLKARKEVGKRLQRLREKRARAKEIRTEVSDPAVMLDRFERHLAQAIDRARLRADRVIVVGQPCFDKDHTPEELALFWNFGVGDVYKEEVTTYYSMKVVGWLMSRLNERADRAAKSCGAEYFDLPFVMEKSCNTFFDELHFTRHGAALVAEAVAAIILRRREPSEELRDEKFTGKVVNPSEPVKRQEVAL